MSPRVGTIPTTTQYYFNVYKLGIVHEIGSAPRAKKKSTRTITRQMPHELSPLNSTRSETCFAGVSSERETRELRSSLVPDYSLRESSDHVSAQLSADKKG